MLLVLFACVWAIAAHNSNLDEMTSIASNIVWIDAQELGVYGNGFAADVKPSPYARLPAAAEKVVRSPVWSLSQDSAGVFVGFQSNSTTLSLNYTLIYSSLYMYHMPMTGVSGADLYCWDDVTMKWMWLATFTYIAYPISVGPLISDASLGGSLHSYMLYLPLYNGVSSMSIGFDPTDNAQLLPLEPPLIKSNPILWYGTSIAQGGVASRPGMAFTNVISRNIGRQIFNFGFSGNGEMELEVAQFLLQISPVAAVIIDCIHNMNTTLVLNRTQPLVQYIRSNVNFVDVPIVLVEGTAVGSQWILSDVRKAENELNEALSQEYTALVNQGIKGLYYVPATDLYSTWDVTVDGVHPTDYGMMQIATYWEAFLPLILQQD